MRTIIKFSGNDQAVRGMTTSFELAAEEVTEITVGAHNQMFVWLVDGRCVRVEGTVKVITEKGKKS